LNELFERISSGRFEQPIAYLRTASVRGYERFRDHVRDAIDDLRGRNPVIRRYRTRGYLGDLVSARRHLDRVLAHYVAPAQKWQIVRFEVDQWAAARAYLARIMWLQGLPDQAMRTAESSAADARATDHAISLGLALALAACPIALWVGDLAAAEHYVEMLLDHSTRHGLARWRAFGRSYPDFTN
jgi:hypothetical protein